MGHECMSSPYFRGLGWYTVVLTDSEMYISPPAVCSANVDLVFMLDQSGSVGQTNHDIALDFLEDVVAFYNISANATQVCCLLLVILKWSTNF